MMWRRISGFSLVEVVISAVVVATTVGALFAVSSMTIRLTTQGQDRIIAAELSRQGLEVVRQIRDANFVSDFCQVGASGVVKPCSDWRYGLIQNLDQDFTSPAVAMGIDTAATQALPYTLVPVSLNNQPCTDFVVRNTDTGAYTTSRIITDDTLGQIFCRRIYIEHIDSEDANAFSQTAIKEGHDAIRIRSQIAWLGFGRTAFRSSFDPLNTACVETGTEWCTEQVMVLTNWRPQR